MPDMLHDSRPVGTVINERYRVLSAVGRGGLGTVYQVVDLLFGQNNVYALKELADQSPGARRQFELESQWLGSVSHPNIPKFREHFEWHGHLYLMMDFVAGENLEQKLGRLGGRGLPERQTVAWILPICDALHYLHTRVPPILHRDLKPANIIVTPSGQPVLVDLGIAKEHLPGAGATLTFVRKAGTEGYAPPEQYTENGLTGPWSDVYGIGATMYHLLTGCVPPTAVDRVALDAKLIHPAEINPAISPHVDAAVCRALALRPPERFRTVLAFSQALMGVAPINSAPRMGQSFGPAQSQSARMPAFPPFEAGQSMYSPLPPATPSQPASFPRAQDPSAWPESPAMQRPARPMAGQPALPERRAPMIDDLPEAGDDRAGEEHAPSGIVTLPRVLIACATLLALLIVGGGAAFLLSSTPPDRSSPTATANGYYNALSHQNYTLAFQFLQDSRNQASSQSSDMSGFRSDDASSGKIVSYTITDIRDNSSTQVSVSVTITRSSPGGSNTISSFALSITQYDGSTWLITNVTPQ
jgi:serine/threonine protein kinase